MNSIIISDRKVCYKNIMISCRTVIYEYPIRDDRREMSLQRHFTFTVNGDPVTITRRIQDKTLHRSGKVHTTNYRRTYSANRPDVGGGWWPVGGGEGGRYGTDYHSFPNLRAALNFALEWFATYKPS